jgi:mannose-6-phosphate isomerase-like protein (cupin superfamily)
MSTISFEDYKAARLQEGFDEVAERVWPAEVVADVHTHPFSVRARVVQGDMWLTARGETRHLRVGDSFELDTEEPHAERYGASGATYWAARKHAQR